MSSESTISVRRCHVCGHVCEDARRVRRCDECGKPFAPFYYYQDEFAPVALDQGLRAPDLPGRYRPIQGLTAYWQMD